MTGKYLGAPERNKVACSTNEEVNTLCIALGLAQRWNVGWLGLPDQMSLESWKELRKVVGKGAVDKFHIVHCETEEEVMIMCAVLELIQKWEIMDLHLPGNMGADGWAALTNLVARGELGNVHVTETALRTGSEQQIRSLWKMTK